MLHAYNVPFFCNTLGTEPPLIDLLFTSKAPHPTRLLRVPSLVQHLFAFRSDAPSAFSQPPRLSYDDASVMSRNSNPVEHTSFPGTGGMGGSQKCGA